MSVQNLIVGMLAGGFVTVLTVMLWPRKTAPLARPVVSAILGGAVAYLLVRFL